MVLFTDADIQEAVVRLAKQIDDWGAEVMNATGEPLVVCPIMNGALFFAADLIRHLRSCVEVHCIWASGYEANGEKKHTLSLNIGGVPENGRHVLLVDDISDTGRTLEAIDFHLNIGGNSTAETRCAVLLNRVTPKRNWPDYIGFALEGPDWVIGYGLDDNRLNRKQSYICTKEEK